MIIVHDIFICKPGNASKLAKMFKEMISSEGGSASGGKGTQAYIMTDLVGQYNKVIMVTTFENLATYEQSFEKWKKMANTAKGKKEAKKMSAYHDMFLTGSREIYRVM